MIDAIVHVAGVVVCVAVAIAAPMFGVGVLSSAVRSRRDLLALRRIEALAWSLDRWCAHDKKVSAAARFIAYGCEELAGADPMRGRTLGDVQEIDGWSQGGRLHEGQFRSVVCPLPQSMERWNA